MNLNEPMEFTMAIEDADLEVMAKVLKDIKIPECPYFDISDKYGNEARYYRGDRWIPCSERLPNDNDYRRCMECLDGAVWYFTENGAMGLGYYYESTKQWSTTDDLRTYGKVIAWMPLPELYPEVEE